MSIQENCMLTSFSAPYWNGKAKDESVNKKIQNDYNTKRKAGDFYKKLMPNYVDAIVSEIGKARKFHYENTLPYDRNGRSILLNTNYFNYVSKMNEFKNAISDKVEEFISVYDRELQKEFEELGDLFRMKDYPTVNELRDKYRFIVNFEPIPSGNNFVMNLEQEEVQKIRGEIEKEVNERIESAVKDLGRRLYTVVSHMHEVLNGNGRIFESVVENIKYICELLPRLNITNDEGIEALRKECLDKLCFFDVETLKNDEFVKNNVAKSAEDIMERLKNYY